MAWLGIPPGPELTSALKRFARLSLGWTPEAAVVCAWAGSGTELLAELPPAKARPKVIAVCPGAPTVRERLQWIRAGADDVQAVDGLAASLLRQLHPNGAPPEPEESPPPPPSPPATPPVEPPPASSLKFPPVWPAPILPADLGAALLDPLVAYIRLRNGLARRLDPAGVQRLIGLTHQRDQLSTSWSGPGPVDPYGQRRGGAPPLDWPLAIRPVEDPISRAQAAQGRLLGLARDGLTLQVDAPKAPRQRLVLDLNLGEQGYVQLLVECRWQRRVAARRWLVGALILRARRR